MASRPHPKITLCHAAMVGPQTPHVVLGGADARTIERNGYTVVRVKTEGKDPVKVGDKVSVSVVMFNDHSAPELENLHIIEVVQQGKEHTRPRGRVQHRVFENVVVENPSNAGADDPLAGKCQVCGTASVLSVQEVIDANRGCAVCATVVCAPCSTRTDLGRQLRSQGLCRPCSTANSTDVGCTSQ